MSCYSSGLFFLTDSMQRQIKLQLPKAHYCGRINGETIATTVLWHQPFDSHICDKTQQLLFVPLPQMTMADNGLLMEDWQME